MDLQYSVISTQDQFFVFDYEPNAIPGSPHKTKVQKQLNFGAIKNQKVDVVSTLFISSFDITLISKGVLSLYGKYCLLFCINYVSATLNAIVWLRTQLQVLNLLDS